MELNIVNREAKLFNEQIGIPEERVKELSDKLDELMEKHLIKGQMLVMGDLFKGIAELCNNLEEVVYCTVIHCGWMAVTHGYIYGQPKKK